MPEHLKRRLETCPQYKHHNLRIVPYIHGIVGKLDIRDFILYFEIKELRVFLFLFSISILSAGTELRGPAELRSGCSVER